MTLIEAWRIFWGSLAMGAAFAASWTLMMCVLAVVMGLMMPWALAWGEIRQERLKIERLRLEAELERLRGGEAEGDASLLSEDES